MAEWQQCFHSVFFAVVFSFLLAKLFAVILEFRDENLRITRSDGPEIEADHEADEKSPGRVLEEENEPLIAENENQGITRSHGTEIESDHEADEKSPGRVLEAESEPLIGENENKVKDGAVTSDYSDSDDDADHDREGVVESTELDETFSAATEFVAATAEARSSHKVYGVQLLLYGLYKIATEGPCSAPPLTPLKMNTRAEWQAWQKLGTMPPEEAMKKYIDIVTDLYPTWLSGSVTKKKKEESSDASLSRSKGPVFSSLIHEKESGSDLKMDDIHTFAREGDKEKLLKCIESGVPLNLKDSEGRTPLHWAVGRGHMNITTLLLNKNADANAKMERGATTKESRVDDGKVTVSDRNPKKPTTSAIDDETTSIESENEAMLPTPRTFRTTTEDTFMGDSEYSYSMEDEDEEEASDDGGPKIDDLIPSYKFHVAHQLWNGEDRGMLTVHSRATIVKTWKITDADVVGLIESSGLEHLAGTMYEQLDEPLLCSFVERWHPETNTFHMPYGEMSICLHDTLFILGLPVAGETITPQCDGKSSEVLRILGNALGQYCNTEEMRALTSWNACSVRQSAMRGLVDRAGGPASRKARVYLWWVLTSTLFVDRSRTHGKASFIELLKKPGEASKYAWGAGALAHLYRELGMSSRSDCKQLGGCLTLLQAWIYAYFPCFRPQTRRSWTSDYPHARRWIPKSVRPDLAGESLREYRLTIDSLTADHVDWLPFGHNPASMVPITTFTGTIHCRSITEAYMPDRFARQFGLAQSIPHPPLVPRRAVRITNPQEYRVDHDPATWAFQRGFQNNTFHGFGTAIVASESVAGYMDWYIPRTHPRLVNGPEVELDFGMDFGMDLYQAIQFMADILSSYHRDVYDGTSAPEWDDIRTLADICEHMMPRFSINRRAAPR